MQTVSELNKNNPEVFRHRHQHFSQVLGLAGAA